VTLIVSPCVFVLGFVHFYFQVQFYPIISIAQVSIEGMGMSMSMRWIWPGCGLDRTECCLFRNTDPIEE
jgi:hypothetical protein